MFYFIEPEEHYLYKTLIFPFLDQLADCPKLNDTFEDWDKATFLLANDKTRTFQGGALFVKQSLEMLPPRIQNHIKTFYPNREDVWRGIVSLQVRESITGRDFEKICKLFYSALISDLVAFSIIQNAPFLCITMAPSDYLDCEMCNFWPYTLKVRPETSRDKLFHGVLTFLKME